MPYYVRWKAFHLKANASATKVRESAEKKCNSTTITPNGSSSNPHLSSRMVLQDVVGFLY